MRLGVGQVVERYRVVRALGTGGTAVVYLVHDTQFGTPHALKVLSVTSQTIRTRMQREGHVQAQLTHANVVQIHDVLELDGSPALLMEYVNGTTLDAALKRYRLTLEDAELLFDGILAGVQAAHDADLVHRDLKPANVLLSRTNDGFVPKVADFGLAKVLFPEPGTAHTRAGISMGTPSYMAPEQIRDAGSVDQRADLWSMGCLLYEIVTRKRAFPGRQALNIYNNVVNGRYEPPQNYVPDLPERIQQAIAGCLQVEADRRIPNCHILREVLSGTRSWAASPPVMLEVPPDAWSEEFWAHVALDESRVEPDADTTSDETAFEDAPLMPLAGSSTGHTASRYLPDDPPAVPGGPRLLDSFGDHEASIVEALELDLDEVPEPMVDLDPHSASSMPEALAAAAERPTERVARRAPLRPASDPLGPPIDPLGPPIDPQRPIVAMVEPELDLEEDVPLHAELPELVLEPEELDLELEEEEQPWRTFIVAAVLLIVLGGAAVTGVVGGAWLAATATGPQPVVATEQEETPLVDAPDPALRTEEEPAAAPEPPAPIRQVSAKPRTTSPRSEEPRVSRDPAPTVAPVSSRAPSPAPTVTGASELATPAPLPEPEVVTLPTRAVLLRSFPFGAQVIVDGDMVGRAPRKMQLPDGRHEVQMVSGSQRAAFDLVVDGNASEGWCYNFLQRELVSGACSAP